ncbi:hypothetical protein AB7849_15165 [Rhodanobacter sp. 115]|uniref:hypothetical protein n=1 Tax=Rhodanobacter sp. FW021-MT20 TaxID=1162282 RepID=UPI0034E51B00
MPKLTSFADAFSDWSSAIKPGVIATYGDNDQPALDESWNDYTDSLTRDRRFNGLQYHYCPSLDDDMPDDDKEFLLERMNIQVSSDGTQVTIKRGSESVTLPVQIEGPLSSEDIFQEVIDILDDDDDPRHEEITNKIGTVISRKDLDDLIEVFNDL